tara:strand:- start:475 stop:1014 length:540 start_codon:yes stop_codon:yes gene_type:complete
MEKKMNKTIPNAEFYLRTLYETAEKEKKYKWSLLKTKELFSPKKIIIFSLPGAFTPTCSTFQLPGFEKLYNDFVKQNIDAIYCVSVNDAFVMNSWAKQHDINNIQMIPDGNAEFTRKIGMLVEKNNLGFGLRSWRYAIICENYEIKYSFIEEGFEDNCDDDPYEKTKPENILKFLEDNK